MKYFIIFLLPLCVISCSSDEEDSDAQNEADILEYLMDNNLTAQTTSSGLYYVITDQGSGANKPSNNSNVTVYYKGYFLDGRVFDESSNTGANFNLGGLIPGFSEGVQLLNEGGKATLLLPAKIAYGSTGSGSIPPGTVILFDIELISIN